MHVTLTIPGVLRQYADSRSRIATELPAGTTVAALLDPLAVDLAVLERRLRDEQGQLRRHVNVYIDEVDVRGTGLIDTPLRDGATLLVLPSMPAVAPDSGIGDPSRC